LQELYLSHNGIRQIDGIQTLVNLEILDLTANRIIKIENLQNLKI